MSGGVGTGRTRGAAAAALLLAGGSPVWAAAAGQATAMRRAELWAAWVAGMLLVVVVGGARHTLRPVRKPSRFIGLRAVAALTTLPIFVGAAYGNWRLPAVSLAGGRGVTLLCMALCVGFLMGSALHRYFAIGAAFLAAVGAVANAHVLLALDLPPELLGGQRLALSGFIALGVLSAAVLVWELHGVPVGAARALWEQHMHHRSLPTALVLSVIPGLGFFYVTPGPRGERRFLAFFCGTLGAYVVFVPFWREVLFYGSDHAGLGGVFFVLCYLGAALGAGFLACTRLSGRSRTGGPRRRSA